MAQLFIPGITRDVTVGAASMTTGSGTDDCSSNEGENYTGTNRSVYVVEVVGNNTIGAAIPDSGNTGTGVVTSGGTYSGTTTRIFDIEMWFITVMPALFYGTGLDNLTSSGISTYAGSDNTFVRIPQADQTTFEWRNDTTQPTYTAPIDITPGVPVELDGGVSVTFATATGHVYADYWHIKTYEQDRMRWSVAGGTWFYEDLVLTPISLDSGVTVTFDETTGNHVDDSWTISTLPDTYKWKENNGSYTTGVVMSTSPVELNKGVAVTFTTIVDHTIGNIWTISVEGDFDIDRSLSDQELLWYVSPEDYTIKTCLLRAIDYNLQTGAVDLIADTNEGTEISIDASSDMYGTVSALSTQEQTDLGVDLDVQDNGLITSPTAGY